MATQSEHRGDLNYAADVFKATDKMRGPVEPSDYKHIALGLIFLKYISDAFAAQRAKLAEDEYADAEDYVAANLFCVSDAARCLLSKGNARSHNCSS